MPQMCNTQYRSDLPLAAYLNNFHNMAIAFEPIINGDVMTIQKCLQVRKNVVATVFALFPFTSTMLDSIIEMSLNTFQMSSVV